jgi:putative SOS response-associated peptidase YedK
MCGRFSLTIDPGELQELFPYAVIPTSVQPRYNIAPSQPIAVISSEDTKVLAFYKWGLVPSWAKDPQIGNKMINARAETLSEKPSFRNAFRRRRCLILADGFYEWKVMGKTKQPMYIYLQDHQPFAFAGLWENWYAPDGSELKSCTIVTTQPNELMAEIHNRMPVILNPESFDRWLDTNSEDYEVLQTLFVPYPSTHMKAHPVSRIVNSPNNDLPDCILPNKS